MIGTVQGIFDACHRQGIPCVLIRPKLLRAPDLYTGDFDLLVPPKQLHAFLKAVQTVCSVKKINFMVYRYKKNKTVLKLFHPDQKDTVDFDVWTELDIRWSQLSRTAFLPWKELQSVLREEAGQWFLEDDFAALYYLSHLGSKHKDPDNNEVKNRLHYYRHLEGVTDQTRMLLEQVSNDLASSVEMANRRLFEMKLVHSSWRHKASQEWFRWRAKRASCGGVMAILGPDGSGKTTVSELLRERLGNARYFRFKRVYRKSLLYKALYAFAGERKLDADGQRLEKNQFDDLNATKLFWFGLMPGWWMAFRARIGNKVLVDRYYQDLLITGSRFKGRPLALVPGARRKLHYVPTSSLMVQLDAPTEVIRSRKDELSSEAIDGFRRLYFELMLETRSPVLVYLNTGQSLDQTKQFIENSNL
ncbi:hypothetical protein [Onishia taeanensis]